MSQLQPRSFVVPLPTRRSSGEQLGSSSDDSQAGRPQVQVASKRNLMNKSSRERKKNLEDSEFHRVLAVLLRPHHAAEPAADEVVDVGRLSAVGQLLGLRTWRQSLGEEIIRAGRWSGVVGGSAESRGDLQLHTHHFHCLTLLFNLAIDECNAEDDFESAKTLLGLTTKLYRIPPDSIHRVYLNSAMQRHKLWDKQAYWEHSFEEDIREQLAPVLAQASRNSSPAAGLDSTREKMKGMQTLCFNLLGNYVFTMMTLGVHVDLARKFVNALCQKFGVCAEKTLTMQKLIDNIHKSGNIVSATSAKEVKEFEEAMRVFQGGGPAQSNRKPNNSR